MFWGRELDARSFNEIGGYENEVIHLTGVCICNDVPSNSKTYLRLKVNSKTFSVACLSNDQPQAKLDLYVSCHDELALMADGHHKLSVTGMVRSFVFDFVLFRVLFCFRIECDTNLV